MCNSGISSRGLGLDIDGRLVILIYSHSVCIELSRDPEPGRESSDYEEYNIVKLEGMNAYEVQFYRGFHQPPPTEKRNTSG